MADRELSLDTLIPRIESDFNIAYSRRRYLRPILSESELRELAELEKACFPPPENYDMRTLRMLVSVNGAGILRLHDECGENRRLVAFHLFDCVAGELITLDVHPEYRRIGLGKTLVQLSLEKLRMIGHDTAVCQIAVTNKASLDLHRKLGFKAVKRMKNYYGPGRDAFLLTVRLRKARTDDAS